MGDGTVVLTLSEVMEKLFIQHDAAVDARHYHNKPRSFLHVYSHLKPNLANSALSE